MKKLLLIATTLICMVFAMAQETSENSSLNIDVNRIEQNISRNAKAYTEILDSLDDGGYRYCFAYDNQYNMITTDIDHGYFLIDYFYDDQNRLEKTISTQPEESFSYQTDYFYDSLGRLSERRIYFGFDILREDKRTLYYDENNNISIIINSAFSNTTNNWEDYERIVFSYNDQLDIHEIVFYRNDANDVWWPEEKDVYYYDNNHNCINSKHFVWESWNTNDWCLENEYVYHYDLDVPSSSIAGLDFSFYDMFYINGINKFCQNKLLYYESLYWKRDGQLENRRTNYYYYSAITGVNETQEKELSIWPNPVDKTLSIEATDLQQVKVLSIDGRPLLTSIGSCSIDVSTLTAGCYILQATRKDGRITVQKFIKR